ncbi:MAG: ATP-binding protein [Defluviicoccus sp.]|nr:ATP-binding protein [Defluviicoccus sp.]
MDEDRLDMSLANDAAEIARVAERIDGFCAAGGVEPSVAYAVNLALDELLSNIISYGYQDEEAHRIELAVRRDGGTLVVTIVDDSIEFDPRQVPDTDTDAPLHERDPGGLGLLLVSTMMDSVDYRREDGRNVTTLTKGPAAE